MRAEGLKDLMRSTDRRPQKLEVTTREPDNYVTAPSRPPSQSRGREGGGIFVAMMKLSFGMKAKRQKFATQLADDEEDEEEKELKRLKSERMNRSQE